MGLARKEIRARGETPVLLRNEPGGAEIARPRKRFVETDRELEAPDPEGRIRRDSPPGKGDPLVLVELAATPERIRRGKTTRIHIVLRPQEKRGVHWNNEAGELAVWIDPPPGVEVDRRRLTAANANAKQPASREPRKVEFEARIGRDAEPGKLKIPAYALYYVCEDVDGVCRYLRQDLEVELEVE